MSLFQVTLSVICNFIFVNPGKYILGPMQMHWFDAQLYCQDMGTSLASIHSESDNNEAISLCNTTCQLSTGCSQGCWLGLNDIEFEGIWEWDDGSITDYGFVNNSDEHPTSGVYPWGFASNKFGPEPNNHGTENCIQLWEHQNFKWNDIKCLNNFVNPICNEPPTINPTNIPTSEPTFFPSKDPTTNPTNIPTLFASTEISSKPPSFSPVRAVLSVGRLNTPTLSPIQIDQRVDATVFESEYSQTGSTNISDHEEITKAPFFIILITTGSVSVLLISIGYIIWRFRRAKVPRMLNVVSNDIQKFNNNKQDTQSAEAEPQRRLTMGEV